MAEVAAVTDDAVTVRLLPGPAVEVGWEAVTTNPNDTLSGLFSIGEIVTGRLVALEPLRLCSTTDRAATDGLAVRLARPIVRERDHRGGRLVTRSGDSRVDCGIPCSESRLQSTSTPDSGSRRRKTVPTTSEDGADDVVPDETAPRLDYEDFFRQHRNRLFDHARRIADNRQQGEDAAQEALIEAYKRWSAVSAMDQPVGWVIRVIAHTLYRLRREGRRLPTAPLTNDRQAVSDPSEAVAQYLDFEDAVAHLPPRQRQIIELWWKSDMGTKEIAAALNIRESSVRTNLARARGRLQVVRGDDTSD
ncbi:RNA polymerase sigma factor [Micromonospora profundi]|uniref:RNA polymerase sigma factor n=1 Tax=Micromonospora profundi TaxID=1420889 RepID=UPI0036AA7C3C